jgi:hypothetical protein
MPARATRVCVNGHDKDVVGRNSQGYCKVCAAGKQRVYTSRKLAVLHEHKRERGCARCGYSESGYALDFHHRDPSTKDFAIGRVLGVSWERIWAEVEKCDVLCRNCHAVLHHEGDDH